MLRRVLHPIGYEYLAVDDVNAVRREAGGKRGIDKRAGKGDRVEVAIEDLDLSAVEVRRQQEVSRSIVEQRESFVDCSRRRVIDHLDRSHPLTPNGKNAVLGIEDELSTSKLGTLRIRHDTSRTAR